MPTIDKIIRSKRKSIALVVQTDGQLIIRAPKRATKRQINALIKKHAAWIAKKQAEALEVQENFAPHRFVEGEEFYFLGEKYALRFVENAKSDLILEGDFQMKSSARENAEGVFERWYKKEARQIFAERVTFYAEEHGFEYAKLKLSSAKRRWGSCSARGNINLTWRLVMTPPEMIDYVVVHELCHLREHNHSKKFWTQVGAIMPEYKSRRKWLKKNGARFSWETR